MTRSRKLLVGGAVIVALGAGGVGLAQAVGDDEQATGPDADRAKAAAVESLGDGRAVSVEREDEGASAWEVEVRRADGRVAEVELNSALKQTAVERDDDGSGEDDEGSDDDDD
jgi:hypothetical protein